jgi:hypothetical protein
MKDGKVDGELLVFVACYARLQELEASRWGIHSIERKGQFTPLEGDEHREYDGLKTWWTELSVDNQLRIQKFVKHCSYDVSRIAMGETGPEPNLIQRVTY